MLVHQHENLIVSSFLLWLNNWILKRGEAYINTNVRFYPTKTTINGYYTYAAPYSQFVADFSVTGANIETGIYVSGTYLTKGNGGFVDINYNKGQVYFSSAQSGPITGSYAVKEVSIAPLTISENKLLFETKFSLRPKISSNATGVATDAITYPCIYVKSIAGQNEPLAFGGLQKTKSNVGLFIFADSQYQLDALNSIIRDAKDELLPILNIQDNPYNMFGGFKSGNFNYDNLASGKIYSGQYAHIERVDTTAFRQGLNSQINTLNPECYFGIVDFDIWTPRMT